MEEKNLTQKVEEDHEFIENIKSGKIKRKELKIPRKAKVKKAKLKKGYIGMIKVDENGNLSGEKVKIEGTIFNIKENTFHATNGQEILMWKGKFPVIIQPTWSRNPLELRKEKPKNETYGDKTVLAMMKKAVLVKKNAGGGKAIIWIVVAIAAIIAISALKKK